MEMKPVLVYMNQDCFTDTDITILHHLTGDFIVVWFYICDVREGKKMRYDTESLRIYSEENNIIFEEVKCPYRGRSLKNLFFFRKVAKRVNKYNPSIIYTCFVSPFWIINKYVYLKDITNAVGIHDVEKHSYGFSVVNSLIHSLINFEIRRSDYIFTFSRNQRDSLRRIYEKESIMVGMSIKDFGLSRQKQQNINNGVSILFFGSIEKYKGLDVLIETLEKAYAMGVDNIRLTIAGKGDYWEVCKNKILTPHLYNIKIRFIDNEEIPDLMCSHHFLILPYRDATQSGPLMTALNYGIPIIAPKFGCFSDTYSLTSAILYEKGELYNALLKVAKMEDESYKNMKNSVLIDRSRFSESNIAQNYINAFKKMINCE